MFHLKLNVKTTWRHIEIKIFSLLFLKLYQSFPGTVTISESDSKENKIKKLDLKGQP